MWQLWHPNHWLQNVHQTAQQAYQDALTQRPAQSRDDIDVSRPQRSRERDEEQMVRREMDYLRMQLREANSRAEQAERAAEELAQQLTSRSNEMAVDSADSTDTAATLEAENKGLKAELDEARSHIFSLQPYRKDLTPKEVGQVSCGRVVASGRGT
jgi:chromosome segregation ATPase